MAVHLKHISDPKTFSFTRNDPHKYDFNDITESHESQLLCDWWYMSIDIHTLELLATGQLTLRLSRSSTNSIRS
jgi:hypothetical protein